MVMVEVTKVLHRIVFCGPQQNPSPRKKLIEKKSEVLMKDGMAMAALV